MFPLVFVSLLLAGLCAAQLSGSVISDIMGSMLQWVIYVCLLRRVGLALKRMTPLTASLCCGLRLADFNSPLKLLQALATLPPAVSILACMAYDGEGAHVVGLFVQNLALGGQATAWWVFACSNKN